MTDQAQQDLDNDRIIDTDRLVIPSLARLNTLLASLQLDLPKGRIVMQVQVITRYPFSADLIPPKLRSKGRFLSIGKLARWGEKMLGVLAVKGRARKGSPLAKLRAALPGFLALRAFVETFASTAVTVSQVMEALKNKGLDRSTHERCCQLAQQLPEHSKVKQRLDAWLSRHIDIQSQLSSLPLIVSSDIVESLFGNFKHILERSPQADMNRTALLIPALCGNPDTTTILNALARARHGDLVSWEQENIPYTMRKKRQAFFDDEKAKKRETPSSDLPEISTA